MSYRVGVVGAGHISEFHLRGLQRVNHVKVIGITDLDHEQAKLRGSEFDIPILASVDELLGLSPHVVHVLTPPASHAEIILDCLQAGCHVFAEKPLATTVADCDRIIAAARVAGKTVGVDHSLLQDPFTLKALEIVRSGKIGDVTNVDCHRSQDWPPYFGGPLPPHYRDGGFPFRDIGIHALYQIEAFLGEIRDAKWSMQKLGNDSNLSFDDWRVTLKCDRGTAHVHLSWNVRPLQDAIAIQGTRGVVRLDRFGMNVTTKAVNRLPEHPQRAVNALSAGMQALVQVPFNLGRIATKKVRRYHGLQEMVREFYESLDDHREPLATADDARRIGYWVEQVASAADREKNRLVAERKPKQRLAKTLVTGATGFIGGHLVERLLANSGEPVRLLCRREPRAEMANDPRIEVVIGDLGDPSIVDQAAQGIERIYHIGGTVQGEHHDFYRGCVAATRNVVDSAIKHHVQQLVYLSSLSVLHSAIFRKDQSVTESWPLEPKADARGSYTQTKLEAETIVLDAVANRGLSAVVLRPAEVIGPGAPLLSSGVAKRVGRWLVILGNGTMAVPLVNVYDLVDAIQATVERDIANGSIYHIVDDQQLTQNQLAAKYVSMTGEDLQVVHVPRWFLTLAALGIQSLCLLAKRPAPLSMYRIQSALAKRRFDCTKARLELGWKPQQGLEKALLQTLAYLRDKQSSIQVSESDHVPVDAPQAAHR